jgi:hypothetical protein
MMQTAVTLDPDDAILRSYLGKAYQEEHRTGPAAKELGRGQGPRPNDPTPWLYSSLLMQDENRPVEAPGGAAGGDRAQRPARRLPLAPAPRRGTRRPIRRPGAAPTTTSASTARVWPRRAAAPTRTTPTTRVTCSSPAPTGPFPGTRAPS